MYKLCVELRGFYLKAGAAAYRGGHDRSFIQCSQCCAWSCGASTLRRVLLLNCR